mmetsp:Transcript_33716/g.54288  ORF Transcript_33716/g.54288 Transcript_33716/m.54288 type:complete len:239 (-) Transcript_33716:327-1043(-)|eukprot:jgi/Bigna1/145768/aug1.103_g20476
MSSTRPVRSIKILENMLETSAAYDIFGRTLQFGCELLLATLYKGVKNSSTITLRKLESSMGTARSVLFLGQFVGVLRKMNFNPKTWAEICQTTSHGSLALFFIVENILFAGRYGLISLREDQRKLLSILSTFFWMFEALPSIPKYAILLKKKGKRADELKEHRISFVSAFLDSLTASHFLGLKPGISDPVANLFGVLTSLIYLRSAYRRAKENVMAIEDMETSSDKAGASSMEAKKND